MNFSTKTDFILLFLFNIFTIIMLHLFKVTFSMLHVQILRNCSTAPSVPKVDNPIHSKKTYQWVKQFCFPV